MTRGHYNKDEAGRRYGRLTVLSKGPDGGKYDRSHWLCKCDCGNTKVISQDALRGGGTMSCGCLIRDVVKERSTTHGETCEYSRGSKEYKAWATMKWRCHNRNNTRYGGRGISVCQRWLDSYVDFLIDVGRAPSPEYSLDRINNNGNYEPGNVEWSTRIRQANNTRRNRLIAINEQVYTVGEWARITGIRYATIYARLSRGWIPERAVFDPAGKPRGRHALLTTPPSAV